MIVNHCIILIGMLCLFLFENNRSGKSQSKTKKNSLHFLFDDFAMYLVRVDRAVYNV